MTSELHTDLPTPRRALAAGAHPDDVEFGCGATLAKWAAAGCEIHHLVCTDGSKGSWDPLEEPGRLVAVRQEEQRAASRALGGKGDVVFLGWPDGELECGLRQRWEVAYWLRHLRPDVVLGHDPWRRYRLHPDHRHAGFLVTDAIVAARDPHFFPELDAEPHRPESLLLWEADEPDHVENVEGFFEHKVAALLEHRSQFRSTMGIDTVGIDTRDADTRDAEGAAAEVDAFRRRVRDQLREDGGLARLPMGEAFKLIKSL
ncbi:MAG: PIG-L family deacetylase [Actinomycetota bacterium]|nr:PIG-L family deacetylase [Actinomycetota bacterium]